MIGALVANAVPAAAATMTLQLGTIEARSGGTITVPVQGVEVPGIGALHVELLYDSTVLTPDTVSRGTLAGSNVLVDSNLTTAGRVVIGLVSLDSIQGDGPLATVKFKVIGAAGTSSPLTLENSKAWESTSHAEVLVKNEAGKVTIVGGSPGWLLWLIIAVALLGVLLVGFLVLSRQRRRSVQTETS
jgi:hypothetical protein